MLFDMMFNNAHLKFKKNMIYWSLSYLANKIIPSESPVWEVLGK